jgi:hypothetical protein
MAAEGASAGEVYIDVLPAVGDFWARVVAQLRPGATKAGEEIGAAAGRALQDRIAAGIEEGLTEGGRRSVPKGTKAGEEYGGAFARAVRTRVEAALKALPDVKIGADATEAERKVAQLRADLQALAAKRIGVDIDAAAALAEVRRIQAELARLAAESPNVQVKVDAARASAELVAVSAEARRLGALDPTVTVHADTAGAQAELAAMDSAARGAGGGMNALVLAGITLGPAIVPAAAAAAAGIAAIGTAAIGAGAGLGVSILAFAGVVGALKDMSAAQQQTSASAVAASARQTALAGAVDQVRSAEAALANTRATAADSARLAAQKVTAAQRTLTQAEATALSVRKALTVAQEEARRAAQDLAAQVAGTAIDERQQVLNVAAAHDALAVAKKAVTDAGTKVTKQQLDALTQAQINYDREVQQQEDLKVRAGRLAQDQAASIKAGIEGSKQVVAARANIVQADDKVAQAQRAVTDARLAQATQERQSAFAIANAQQSVISAQRSLEQATVSAGRSGSAAMDKLHQAMANLSPEGRSFATFLFGLRGNLRELQHVAEAGLLPGVQRGIQLLLPFFPQLERFVGGVAATLGRLAEEGARALTSPFWQKFFGYIAATASPALQAMASIVTNVAKGFAGLLIAFNPVAQQVIAGLTRMAASFATWSASLATNQGFQRFLDYARQVGPVVVATVVDLTRAALKLVEALAPIGGVVLTGLRGFAAVIQAIPVPVLTGLLGVIVAVVAATKLWALAQVVQTAALVAGRVVWALAGTAAATYQRSMAAATVTTGQFGGALTHVQAGVNVAKTGLSGMVSFLGGPWGIALIGATVLVGAFIHQQQESRARVDSLRGALLQLSDAYKEVGFGSGDALKSLVQQDKKLQDLIINAGKFGIAVKDIASAVDGDIAAQKRVIGAYEDEAGAIQTLILLKRSGQATSADYAALGLDEKTNLDNLLGTRYTEIEALKGSFAAKARAAEATKILTDSESANANAVAALDPAYRTLQTTLDTLTSKTATAADKSNALKAAQDALTGAARTQKEAEEAYYAAVDNSTAAVGRNTATLDIHTQAGRENRDAIEARLQASNDMYYADVAAGISTEVATKRHRDRTQALIDEAKRTHLNTGEVTALIGTYGRVPTDVNTNVKATGVQAVLQQMEDLYVAQQVLKEGITVEEATRRYASHGQKPSDIFRGHAEGGYISGPGGPTDDLIPSWLSNGEYVIPARVVASLGVGFFDELINVKPRASKPGDGSQGIAFAKGGLVWPFPVNASHVKHPTLAQIRDQWTYGLDWTGTVSAQVASVQNWIKAQAGKPYIWASAGPAGYDCSGITSAALNLLAGRNPYQHTFSTANEAGYFPKAGYGVYTAGWAGPGERGGGSVGHTAGLLAGLAFESRGGDGVVVGPNATKVNTFAHLGHAFDSGGYLPPGLSIADNRTGGPEPVLTRGQFADLHTAATSTSDSGGRELVHIDNFHANDRDPHSIAVELDWRMRGLGG